MRTWNRWWVHNPPCNHQIHLVCEDLLVEFEWLPGWPSIHPNATVIPSLLVMLNLLQDELIQLDHIHVLINDISLEVLLLNSTQRYTPSFQIDLQYCQYKWWDSYHSFHENMAWGVHLKDMSDWWEHNSRSDVWPLIEKLLGCSSKGGLYTPPPFPAGLQLDSIRLDLFRMPNLALELL